MILNIFCVVFFLQNVKQLDKRFNETFLKATLSLFWTNRAELCHLKLYGDLQAGRYSY